MADNFDLRKFITEAKLKIKVPVKEMSRPAKEKYKLNSDFPQIKDRIANPGNFKLDRKQQVVNYFVKKAKEILHANLSGSWLLVLKTLKIYL